ncbi:hypothetical Protein YC6258_02102 [Gynuella sunshinyii YC6258]|uniref:Uncharacterized protein n=1 Tax=Gynuella sunshinyii YC6258 TaxID=1445510 RepID=A0A0C5VUS5_9GAMM|nr:hypothetical Protein YC6258_02102 [Gynuella sunshinyii YC6258]
MNIQKFLKKQSAILCCTSQETWMGYSYERLVAVFLDPHTL